MYPFFLTAYTLDILYIWFSSFILLPTSLTYPYRSITPGVRQPDGLALDEFKEFKDMEQKVLVYTTSLP